MAILNNSNAISTAGGYDINNSLRLRSSASAYLSKTYGSNGNTKIFTYSFWAKLGTLSTEMSLLSVYSSVGYQTRFTMGSGNALSVQIYNSGSYNSTWDTTAVFRDPSAWYHVMLVGDTTGATASNYIKIYINGVQQTTTYNLNSQGAIPQNTNILVCSTIPHTIGKYGGGSNYLDGYMAEAYLIDGQALTPSSFGETDTTTGSWKPKAYSGTYGTNGFYLKFSDIATTSGSNAGLGKDFSGNANYWTTNNISVTAGTTYDAMIDSPTLTSATVANYAVANPLDKSTNVTVTNGNLTVSTAVTNAGIRGSMYVSSGKYYWEATCTTKTNYPNLGIADAAWGLTNVGSTSGSYGYATDALKYNNGSTASYGATYTTGDVIGVALDLDAGTLVFYKNNTSQGTAYSSLSGTFAPAFAGQASDVWNVNFGQRPFTYTPPSGFKALNTYNLPDSTIKKGNTVMDATIWSGNGTFPRSITNSASFKPDLVWTKSRSNAYSHLLFDSVRGAGTNGLASNETSSETVNSAYANLSSFNSDGFTFAAPSGTDVENANGTTAVAWQWQAGAGTTSTNTSGSISSTVSVNATAGFSIVTFTANGVTGATVGHGLGVAPKMMIVKCRSNTQSWPVYHTTLGNTKYLMLNTTAAEVANIGMWNNTSPTSTVFTIGDQGFLWGSGFTYVVYCWAEIAGFSKFGSYTGNGSTDGPFVY
jgi:hypothetical protein